MFYLFPYKSVVPNEKIIIYGAGEAGKCFVQQIKASRYCEIVAVADRIVSESCLRNIGNDVPLISPTDICKMEFDKVVISIWNRDVVLSVRNELVTRFDIAQERIIIGAEGGAIQEAVKTSVKARSDAACYKEGISIAFFSCGGIGDNIIAKKFLTELLGYTKGSICNVDIYVSKAGLEYAPSLFADCDFVNEFFSDSIMPRELTQYDVVIRFGYVLGIHHLAEQKISTYDSGFFDKLKQLQRAFSQYGLDAEGHLSQGTHFARCKLFGFNCYTAYNYGNVLNITDSKVDIPLLEEYVAEYKELSLKNYITINFGWGYNPQGRNKLPNKVWPIRHYEEFVRLFHEAFPNITVVQLGINDSFHIESVDKYVFGKSLEVVKYVLRDSLLHIDCEGGLVHLATQLGTKCVVLFGPTPVHYFGYDSNINIVSQECRNCYYLYDDFSVCARGLEEPECMASIAPKTVLEKVSEYLKTNQR